MVISRVTGLSGSGIDIDAQVKALMKAERVPLDKLKQKKQTLEWQRDNYREMNALLVDFRNSIGNLKLQSTFSTKKTSSANDNVLSVSASSLATEGKYSVKVDKLAQSAQLTSGDVTIGAGSETTKMSTLGLSGDTTITITGEKGTASVAVRPTDTVADVMKAISNKSGITGVNASYDANLDRIFISSINTGSTSKVELKSTDPNLINNVLKLGTASPVQETVSGTTTYSDPDSLINASLSGTETLRFTYDGVTKDYAITNTTKISDLINSINADYSSSGVKASLNEKGQLSFSNADKSKDITFADATGSTTVLADLGLTSPTTVNQTGQKITSSKTFIDGSALIDSAIPEGVTETFRINYNGKDYDFSITKDTKVSDLLANINNSDLGSLGVSASLDSTGAISIFNPDDSTSLAFSDQTSSSEDMLASLGLSSPTTTNGLTSSGVSAMGSNAKIEFNGVPGTYKSNTFTISGMTFTAKQESTTAVDVNITKDVDAVFNTIKDFISKYNDMISKVNTKLLEKHDRDFTPLTDDQRSEMKDDEITKWEDKAKAGLLHGDSILSTALDKFRNYLTSPVTGVPSGDLKQLSELGITTGSYEERGKLYIMDEAKLKKAIGEHPEQVIAMFTKTDGNSTSDSGDGIAVRLYNELSTTVKKLTDKAGASLTVSQYDNSVIGKNLNDIDKNVDSMTSRLQDIEDRYYRQFSAMETALSKINSQGDYLYQQFGQ